MHVSHKNKRPRWRPIRKTKNKVKPNSLVTKSISSKLNQRRKERNKENVNREKVFFGQKLSLDTWPRRNILKLFNLAQPPTKTEAATRKNHKNQSDVINVEGRS